MAHGVAYQCSKVECEDPLAIQVPNQKCYTITFNYTITLAYFTITVGIL